ncbi:unnamed protein product [Caenorhabditis bovis]|uniref:Uncharacterized protein n=1 Tax=Caenorhabditis bovis TaxID=2654633 RepID=A0A8S1ETA0_9PELO|nr:unnamed protein product [Caenorhabditis bovis]
MRRCEFDNELLLKSIATLLALLIAPVYLIAFYALIWNCPKYFHKYRTLLMLHVVGNLSFDAFMSFVWHPHFILPWVACCAVGIAWQFPYAMFTMFFVHIVRRRCDHPHFKYRMECVLIGQSRHPRAKGVAKFLAIFQIVSIATITDFVYGRQWLVDPQRKIELNQVVYCEQCVLIANFNYIHTYILFVASAFLMISAIVAIAFCELSAHAALSSMRSRVSPKTHELHSSFLRCLVRLVAVHVGLLGTPVGVFALAHLVEFRHRVWSSPLKFAHFQISPTR